MARKMLQMTRSDFLLYLIEKEVYLPGDSTFQTLLGHQTKYSPAKVLLIQSFQQLLPYNPAPLLLVRLQEHAILFWYNQNNSMILIVPTRN
jgi:hypothetical protein